MYEQQELVYGVHEGWGSCYNDYGIRRDVVSVRELSGVIEYKWGQDGLYEVELVNVQNLQRWQHDPLQGFIYREGQEGNFVL